MKRSISLFLTALALFVLSAYLMSSSPVDRDRETLRKAPAAIDDLTDELLYISEISRTAEQHTFDTGIQELARQVDSTAKAMNRELCRYIIDKRLDAKQKLNDEQRRMIYSLIGTDREGSAQQYKQLLLEALERVAGLYQYDEDQELLDKDILQQLRDEHAQLEAKLGSWDERMALR